MFKSVLPAIALLFIFAPANAQKLINDRQISILSSSDVHSKRAALIQYIWGVDGFPAEKMPRLPIIASDVSPIKGLTDLERVDTLVVDMEAGLKSYAHHFLPRIKNNRLVILHGGHFSTFDDSDSPADVGYGMRRTIEGLLGDGYSVLAVYMPLNAEFHTSITVADDGGPDAHNQLFLNEMYQPEVGSPLKYFLEPVAAYLNYMDRRSAADNFPAYLDVSMVGFSGGGWTTTVYAALDTRIKVSISVAGSLPLYLRSGPVGDAEQTDAGFYSIAGYPDLYVMGSHGADRKQIQILNRNDWCCFSEVHHDAQASGASFDEAVREFELKVRETLTGLGNNDLFSLEIDEAAPGHNVTWDAIYDTILPELNGGLRSVATATGEEAIARGTGGRPAVFINGIWSPSKLPYITGTPALLRGSVSIYDMFFRNGRNQLVHVYRPPMTWSRPNVLLDKVISDPVAASRGPGTFDVVAIGSDYKLYHVRRQGSVTTTEVVSDDVKGIGQLTLIASTNQLDLFYKSLNRRLYHGRKTARGPWVIEEVGGRLVDFPTAIRMSDGSFRAYVHGTDGALWEARRPVDAPWTNFEKIPGSGPVAGSPSAALVNEKVEIYSRTPGSQIRRFAFGKSWGITDLPGYYSNSPTASPIGMFTRDTEGSLVYTDGIELTELGGALD